MFVSHMGVTVGSDFAHKKHTLFLADRGRVPGEVCVFCLAVYINRKCAKTFMGEVAFTLF